MRETKNSINGRWGGIFRDRESGREWERVREGRVKDRERVGDSIRDWERLGESGESEEGWKM